MQLRLETFNGLSHELLCVRVQDRRQLLRSADTTNTETDGSCTSLLVAAITQIPLSNPALTSLKFKIARAVPRT